MAQDELVTRIYEAVASPELWAGVLDGVAAALGAAGAMLDRNGQAQSRMIASAGSAAWIANWAARGHRCGETWPRRPDRKAPLLSTPDLAAAGGEVGTGVPCYRNYLLPAGGDGGEGVRGGSDPMLLTVVGFPDRAAFAAAMPRLEQLRPHLARAALLTAELELRKVRAAVEALDRAGTGAAMLDSRGQLLAANDRFDAAIDGYARAGRDRLRLIHRAADGSFTAGLEALLQDGVGCSIPLRDEWGVGRAALHLLPAAGAACETFFTGAAAIALVAQPSGRDAPDSALIQGLFDLTPAEAAVARAITAGASVEMIAQASGKSVETVRSHLKRVFSKTATGRQNELAVLLMGFAAPHRGGLHG